MQADDGLVMKEYDRCKLAALGQDPGSSLSQVTGGG
jgi:hypothetical protein